MTQNRSFKDYVATRFYHKLYDAVSKYLEQNHQVLDVSSRRERQISKITKTSVLMLSTN